MVFLIVILCIWRPKKSFPLNLGLFYQRFVVLAWCLPLIIVFNCENFFHPSGAFQESFQFGSPKAIISGLFIPTFSYCSPNHTGASFKYSLIRFWSLCSHIFIFHQFRFIHSQFAVIILRSYRCIVQVISNQFAISLLSWI